MRPRAELIRLVRDEAGNVRVDRDGVAAGRGAYMCAVAECVEKALQAVPGVGETKASSILAAATAWVAEHPAPVSTEPSTADDGAGGSEVEPSPLER